MSMRIALKLLPVHIEIIRFLLVGALNTLFGYAVFSLFLYLKFHYSMASFLGIVLGILFNFKTYGRLVFKCRDNSLIFRFIFFYAVLYAVSVVGLWAFNYVGINLYVANAIMLLPISALSFYLNRNFVFVR